MTPENRIKQNLAQLKAMLLISAILVVAQIVIHSSIVWIMFTFMMFIVVLMSYWTVKNLS